jgi:iduronate 2-sulfatase
MFDEGAKRQREAASGRSDMGDFFERCRMMLRFLPCWVMVILGILVVPVQAGNNEEPVKKKLNVLFIIADDLRTDLGCYGHGLVRSPNLDRLAKKGVRFERAYCQAPICNPSRTSFLTGLRPDTTQVSGNNVQFRTKIPEVVTLGQLFRMHGYFSASLGKVFHRGLTIEDIRAEMDDAKSWDLARYFVGTSKGRKGEGRNLTGGKLPWCQWLAAEGTDLDQPDGMIAHEAAKFLEQQRDQPFFLAVGFHRPHDPFIAPKKYYEPYPLDRLTLARDPEKRSADVKLAIPGGFDFSVFGDQERREFMRAYYAGISFMDAQVGKILEVLDRLNLWENTIVIFVSDHGYHLGERGWWNKNTLFELSARVPLMVYSPSMKAAGQTSPRLVELVDLYPTLTHLCQLPTAKELEGVSFHPLLDEPTRAWKSGAFTQVQRGKVVGRSVRTERYRFTEWDEGKVGVELYDHQNDPGEYNNLATASTHAETLAELRRSLRGDWQNAVPEKRN